MGELHPSVFFFLDHFEHSQVFKEVKYVWNALDQMSTYFSQYELGRIDSPIPEGVVLKNKDMIRIHKNCQIEPGSYIEGPCILSEGTIVRHGAYLRGNIITGKHAVIGHASEIKNSIFLDEAKAPHFNYVGDSILGNSTNLGAGAICSNLRLDHKNIVIRFSDKVYDTKQKKLGLILGDLSQIGCNVVTNPGTFIGKNSICYPNMNVKGWIKENSIIKQTKN